MLAVGDLAQGNLALGVAKRCDIDHQSEGIAALGRNEHTYPSITLGTYITDEFVPHLEKSSGLVGFSLD